VKGKGGPFPSCDVRRRHVIKRLVLLAAALLLLLSAPGSKANAIQPPSLPASFEARSARTYMDLERQFVYNYLFDPIYGGTYLSVGGQGNVLNDSKDIIFQTNVILFLVGMSAQSPDPNAVKMVNSAAQFILKYLKWGAGGPGTWYQFTNRSGGDPRPVTWEAASEAYVSYGLIWAYEFTGNTDYLNAAQVNLNYQMKTFPDGHILTDLPSHAGDITYRSPERMAYYAMWKLTGNQSYLNYAEKIETAAYGRTGWERVQRNGTTVTIGVHGSSITDEVLYGFLSGDQTALTEGTQSLEQYWAGGYSGREDYQDFLEMDLALWTLTHDPKYQAEAIKAYDKLLEFWDPNPPYGFWADLSHVTKTCFTRGYPTVDITPPTITADPNVTLPLMTITARIVDPQFKWLDFTFDGIGLNPSSVYFYYSLDGIHWSDKLPMIQLANDTFVTTLPRNIWGQNPQYFISASDYFNNTSTVQFTKNFTNVPSSNVSSTLQFTSANVNFPTTILRSSSSSVGGLSVGVVGLGGLGLWVLGLGLGGGLLVVGVLALLFRRPGAGSPAPAAAPAAAGAERNLYCRCPYWVECARVHSQCPTCARLRQLGACCACYIMPPDTCNHPSGLGPVYGPHVDYGPNMNYPPPRNNAR